MIFSSGVTAYLIITNILLCNNIFYDTRFLSNDANTVGLLLRSFDCYLIYWTQDCKFLNLLWHCFFYKLCLREI